MLSASMPSRSARPMAAASTRSRVKGSRGSLVDVPVAIRSSRACWLDRLTPYVYGDATHLTVYVRSPMKAIVYRKYGSPDVLQLQEVDKPSPREGDVLVRVHAAAVNPLD